MLVSKFKLSKTNELVFFAMYRLVTSIVNWYILLFLTRKVWRFSWSHVSVKIPTRNLALKQWHKTWWSDDKWHKDGLNTDVAYSLKRENDCILIQTEDIQCTYPPPHPPKRASFLAVLNLACKNIRFSSLLSNPSLSTKHNTPFKFVSKNKWQNRQISSSFIHSKTRKSSVVIQG